MKKLYFLSVVVSLLLSGESVFAQSVKKVPDGWGTLYVEYNPISFDVDDPNSNDYSLTGFSFGYNQAFLATQDVPLYIETGAGLQYMYQNDLNDVDDLNFKMFSIKVPVNIAYAIQLNNASVSLIPFVGATARYNLSGKISYDGETIKKNGITVKNGQSWDIFNKKDMTQLGSMDGKAWKRLQFGWQIGVKLKIGDSFLVGASYGSDFSELAHKTKISTTSIALGLTF